MCCDKYESTYAVAFWPKSCPTWAPFFNTFLVFLIDLLTSRPTLRAAEDEAFPVIPAIFTVKKIRGRS